LIFHHSLRAIVLTLYQGEKSMYLKPKTTPKRTIGLWAGVAVLVVGGIAMLVFAFSGSGENAGGDVDVNAIYTNAAATVAAQQQTLQAGTLAVPTSTTANLATPTLAQLLSPTPTTQTSLQLPTIRPATSVVSACDKAVYVSDVTIPDNTVVAAGESFTKTWKVTNAGTCTWTSTYKLTFVSGDSLGGKATAINQSVAPGQSVDISVVLTSTSTSGTITGRWRLANDSGQPFGDELTVVIMNSASATGSPTPTPTGTITSKTATKTPTPTITPVVIVVTATFTPTPEPPTETPIPTEVPTALP
jgi:hypothetical protein